MEGVVNGDANALLALSHTEGAAQFYLVTQIVLRDKILQLLYYLSRTLDVAGGADTYGYFHAEFSLFVLDDVCPAEQELALRFVALYGL